MTRLLFITALLLSASLCQAQTPSPSDTNESAAAPDLAQGLQARPWLFTVGPYVHHWSSNPEHRRAFVFALEKHVDGERLVGLSLFRNSFGQPSAYAYAGYHWHGFLGDPRLTAKVTAGIIYGYTGKYEDKVPLNLNGFSPGLIPSISYKVSQQDYLGVLLLGSAGFVLTYGHSF